MKRTEQITDTRQIKSKKQITDTILMIRPVSFRMNEQTAVNNYYQKQPQILGPDAVQAKALEEFDAFVEKLRAKGVKVIVVQDTETPDTPDSIFPNNWISFHQEGEVGVYPMFAENRRLERREEVFQAVEEAGRTIKEIVDYTSAEQDELFLEATGSIVLDRQNKLAYCAISPRADEGLFVEFCEDFEYTPVVFRAYQSVDGNRELIYHTNVMMALTENQAVVCLNCVDDPKERKHLVNQLKSSGKQIVEISEAQVEQFAGNMLQVQSDKGERILVMSEAAYKSLNPEQKRVLEAESTLLYSDLEAIEFCGGGSARCMMAEVF